MARFHNPSLYASLVKQAQMVERHLEGILAHWKWGLTNAFMEGLNSVFSATKRKARGYRSTVHLTAMLYFVAGKLRWPKALTAPRGRKQMGGPRARRVRCARRL